MPRSAVQRDPYSLALQRVDGIGSFSQKTAMLHRGSIAVDLLDSPHFSAAWDTLIAECPHATTFQAPAFVLSWYRIYASFEPIVVHVSDGEGLQGVLFLALDRARRRLVHVGAHQAEYQAWLARPGFDEVLLQSAWAALRSNVEFDVLVLRYLPQSGLLHKVLGIPQLQNLVRARTVPRPLYRIDAEDIRSTFAKKSNKSRLNRLKRLGTLEFKRVRDGAELRRIFRTLTDAYDLRQGAVNHTSPFREDARKAAFHLAVFDAAPDQVHVTVTYLNGEPIAALWGMVSGGSLQLGMLIHAPVLAEHSPGKIHLMLLSEHLLGEGMAVLDLTPGGDPWKERFANAHDEVAELCVYSSAAHRRLHDMQSAALDWTKTAAAKVGLTPDDLRAGAKLAARMRPGAIFRQAKRWISTDSELRIYRLDRNSAARFRADSRFQRNNLADLLAFESYDRWQTRDIFLSNALARLEGGETAFTCRVDSRLAHCGWLVRNQAQAEFSEVDQTLALPGGSAVIYDFFTHPDYRGRGLYRAGIANMLAAACEDPGTRFVYICVLADNAPSRHVIESMGFQYRRSLYSRSRFGSAPRKWSSVPAPEAPVLPE